MNTRVQEIFNEIRRLEIELHQELQHREKELSYEIKERAILFKEEVIEQHLRQVVSVFEYLRRARWRNMVTAPIIWLNLFPILLLDAVVSLFQLTCFPVYKIPKVKRSDHVVIDRQQLNYLNVIEKVNCVYCGYFNGVIAYTQEVAARTEQYWCPIKHAHTLQTTHSRYKKFSDFDDSDEFHKNFTTTRNDFDDLRAAGSDAKQDGN